MNSSTRQRKRRLTDADEDSRQNTDDHTPNPKRQRVSRACDSCRLKKDKCDGVRPVCSTCASLSRPCTYKSNPKKRGLPTGYLRTLELLWGLVFGRIQGSEGTVRALMAAENIPGHLASMGKEAEFSDGLVSSWKNSAVYKEIERILTLLEQGEDGQDRAAQDLGDHELRQDTEGILSGDILEWHIPEGLGVGADTSRPTGLSPANVSTATSTARNTTRDCGIQTLPPEGSMDERNRPIDGSTQHSTDMHRSSERRLRLPPNAWPLFDIYFSYTQCWFPILEKHDILRTAFRYTEDDILIPPSSPGSGEHAALWAVLALSSFQEASAAAPSTTDASDERETPHRLYAITKSLIPSEIDIYEIGHVQALLVLSLVKLGQQQWATAWMLIGQAIRIARYLKLDSLAGMQPKDTGDVNLGRSKHVFLGCFVLETLISMQTARVPSLRKEDLAKVGSVNEDGLEEWHPWEGQTGLRLAQPSRNSFQRGPLRSLSSFNRLVSLMSVLNDFCLLKQSRATSMSEVELLERQLQQWVTETPKSSRVDLDTIPSKVPSPHIFGLEVSYEGLITLSLRLSQRTTFEISHQRRANDSSKRLLKLFQTYMEAYSVSATSPIFGMILTWAINSLQGSSQNEQGEGPNITSSAGGTSLTRTISREATPRSQHARGHHFALGQNGSSSENGGLRFSVGNTPEPSFMLESDLKDKLRTLSSQLKSVWSVDESATTGPSQNTGISSGLTANPMVLPEHNAMPGNVAGERSGTHLDIPSLAGGAGTGINASPMLPDLSIPVHPTPVQYPAPYGDPNMNLDAFVDIDEYEPRRPRIAPDLDALFDELASLDGTERSDNQPEFMQNLGFVPNTGIPEFYSYSGQADPFLLAQTQQLSYPEAAPMRQEPRQSDSRPRT